MTLLLAGMCMTGRADELLIRGGPERVHLLELFTSEGCSSCPPAEASFARLLAKEKLWTRLVPVAWHVDYWDYLGWHDRFGSPSNSNRERAYAAAWRSHSVYTPCFALNGHEWRNNAESPKPDAPGILEARLKGNDLQVKFVPGTKPERNREASVALLGGEESSHVTAGENAGQELKHLFVARAVLHQNMTRSGEAWTASFQLPKESNRVTALAVWVGGGIPHVEQAAGGWLRKP